MNLDELTEWAHKVLAHLKQMEKEHLQNIEKNCNGLKQSEAHLKELLDKFGWVKEHESMLQDISAMLLIGRIVRQKIRTEHLHKKTAKELELELQNLDVGDRADQFTGKLLDFLTDQTKELEQMALGCTEIIESGFGKMKQVMDEDTKDGVTPFILSLAACMGNLDLETIKKALRTCSKKQVKAWAATNVGETVYSQRRRLFNPFRKRKKKQELLLQHDGGLDHTGIFTDDVVNF